MTSTKKRDTRIVPWQMIGGGILLLVRLCRGVVILVSSRRRRGDEGLVVGLLCLVRIGRTICRERLVDGGGDGALFHGAPTTTVHSIGRIANIIIGTTLRHGRIKYEDESMFVLRLWLWMHQKINRCDCWEVIGI